MLLEELSDRKYPNSAPKNEGDGIEISTGLQKRAKHRANQHFSRKSEPTFLGIGKRLSYDMRHANSDEQLLKLCAKIGTERNPKQIAAHMSLLIKALAEEQNAIKAKISASLTRLITPPW